MRKCIPVLIVVFALAGCGTQLQPAASPAQPTTNLALVCEKPDARTLAMIAEKIDLGSTGPYNPTVVRLSDGWEIVSFGWGASQRDTYLAQDTATDPAQWLLACSGDVCHWDQLNLPGDVAAEAQEAAQVATPCVQGG